MAFNGLNALLGLGAGAPSAAAADAPLAEQPANIVTDEQLTQALATARAEGVAAGVAQERARTATVLASDHARANVAAAAFALAESDAPADRIVAALPAFAAQAAPAAPAAPEPAKPALSVSLDQTPKVDLGAPAGSANDGTEAAADPTNSKMLGEVRAQRGVSSILTGSAGLQQRGGH